MSDRIHVLSEGDRYTIIDALRVLQQNHEEGDEFYVDIDELCERINMGGTEHITALVDDYRQGEWVTATFWMNSEDAMRSNVLDVADQLEEGNLAPNESTWVDGPAPLSDWLRDEEVPLEKRYREAIEWFATHQQTSIYICQNFLNTEVTN